MEQVLYKKRYSISEFNDILFKGLRTFKFMSRGKKSGKLSNEFIKRIMLAVTEVNGCEVCSYAHTKDALEMGMKEEDIQQILSGENDSIPNNELKAILFAQHYAETKGYPSEDAWNEIVEYYGKNKALGILGAIRVIMVGNSYGIALSAFKSRLKGEKIASSNLLYEISMLVSLIPLLPVNIIQIIVANVKKTPIIEFSK